jgi:hypothetical protein
MITFTDTNQNQTGNGGGFGNGTWYGDGSFYRIILQIHGFRYGEYYGHKDGGGFGDGLGYGDGNGDSDTTFAFKVIHKKYPHNLIIL